MSSLRVITFFVCTMVIYQDLLSQTDSTVLDNVYQLTIEEDLLTLKIKNLGDPKVTAASRTTESTFESVVTVSVITDEEIKKSGATLVPEALRLSPDVLVRQRTNGYYHVQIGSEESVGNAIANYESTNVLLTINGIPFHDNYQGGIFWETLPIGLVDIKQIEVIRTPSSALYGNQALAGIINIVTKTVDTKYLKANGNFQGGNFNTFSHQASASFAALDQGLFKVSAHYNVRDRFQDSYYITDKNGYVPSDSLLFYKPDVERTNTYTYASLSNFGINGVGSWRISRDINIEASYGNSNSNVQSILQGLNNLLMSNRSSKSTWISLQSEVYGLKTIVAYQDNSQNLGVGYKGFALQSDRWYVSADYLYKTNFVYWQMGGALQYDRYENQDFVSVNEVDDTAYQNKIVAGNKKMQTQGLYLAPTLYALNGKLKFTVNIRGDYLSDYNKFCFSSKLGTLFRIDKKNALRLTYSEGYQPTSLMQQQYATNISQELQPAFLLSGKIQRYEIGFRSKPLNELYLDLTFFDRRTLRYILGEAGNTLTTIDNQYGFTVTNTLTLNKIKAQPFLTYAHVRKSQKHLNNKLYPSLIGGFTANYSMFLNKLIVGAHAYMYNDYAYLEYDRAIALPGKKLVDCKISYNFFREHTIYASGKNVLNDRDIEFPYADQVGRVFLLGVDFIF